MTKYGNIYRQDLSKLYPLENNFSKCHQNRILIAEVTEPDWYHTKMGKDLVFKIYLGWKNKVKTEKNKDKKTSANIYFLSWRQIHKIYNGCVLYD